MVYMCGLVEVPTRNVDHMKGFPIVKREVKKNYGPEH